MRYVDPDGREIYNSEITEDQFNKIAVFFDDNFELTLDGKTWEETQQFFIDNPNGCIYRNPDGLVYKFYSNKNDIQEYNMFTTDMVDLLLIGKGVFNLVNSIKNILTSKLASDIAKDAIIIGGREYSKHALERMEQRKIVPMIVEETIKRGVQIPGKTFGTTIYLTDEAKVILNESGKVITVMAQ